MLSKLLKKEFRLCLHPTAPLMMLLSALTLGLLGVFYVNPYKYSTGAELYQVLKNQ